MAIPHEVHPQLWHLKYTVLEFPGGIALSLLLLWLRWLPWCGFSPCPQELPHAAGSVEEREREREREGGRRKEGRKRESVQEDKRGRSNKRINEAPREEKLNN